MNPRARWIWTAVLAYTLFHLGYSVVRYSVFSGVASGDYNRAYQEATQWEDPKTQEFGVWHPPFYYWVLRRLSELAGGQRPLALFLYFLQFVMFPAAIFLLVRAGRLGRRPPPQAFLLAAALAFNFQPLLETLAQHKVEGMELFLICAAVAAYRKRWDFLCGAAVVLAANLKWLPGILVLYFLIKRERKVIAGMVITQLAVMALLIGVYGWDRIQSAMVQHPLDLLLAHKYEGTVPSASVEMQTLCGMINRWLARPHPGYSFMYYIETENYMPAYPPALAQALGGGLRLLLAGVWVFFIRRRWPADEREKRWPRILLELSLTLVMIPMLSQLARVHYGILVLPAFVLAALLMLQRKELFRRRDLLLLGPAYALSAMLIPGGLLNRLPPMPVWGQYYSELYLWLSLPVYGYLLLGAWILIASRRLSGPAGGGLS